MASPSAAQRRGASLGRAAAATARGAVKSCARTLDVLELFARGGEPARTSEVSERLGIPNSSVDEILRTLAARGYLQFNEKSKRYAPSYKLIGLSAAIERGFFGDGRLRALLEDLRSETGASVCMTARNDFWCECIAELDGDWADRNREPDYRRELLCFDGDGWRPSTNFAGALLALQSNAELVELAVRTQAVGSAPKGATPIMNDLIDRVARIRARGFALCRRDDAIHVESIACPMRLPSGDMPVAVGLLGDHLLESDQAARKLAMTMHGVIAHHSRSWSMALA